MQWMFLRFLSVEGAYPKQISTILKPKGTLKHQELRERNGRENVCRRWHKTRSWLMHELSRNEVLRCHPEERAHKWQCVCAQRGVDRVLGDNVV